MGDDVVMSSIVLKKLGVFKTKEDYDVARQLIYTRATATEVYMPYVPFLPCILLATLARRSFYRLTLQIDEWLRIITAPDFNPSKITYRKAKVH